MAAAAAVGGAVLDINRQPTAIQHAVLSLILSAGVDRCQWVPKLQTQNKTQQQLQSACDPVRSILVLFATTPDVGIRKLCLEVLVQATTVTTGVVCPSPTVVDVSLVARAHTHCAYQLCTPDERFIALCLTMFVHFVLCSACWLCIVRWLLVIAMGVVAVAFIHFVVG